MIELAYNLSIFFAFLTALFSLGFLALYSPFRRTPMGTHLWWTSAIIFLIFGMHVVLRLWPRPITPTLVWIQVLLFAGAAIVMGWRFGMRLYWLKTRRKINTVRRTEDDQLPR